MASTELPLDELARRITSGAVRLAAATATWLGLVAEFDRREGWGGYGIRSCAHWLAWQCGLSTGAAREHVRVARALTDLPATTAAFAGGRLSYSKVRAITRVADRATEGVLLELAHETTASQLERVVREWRRDEAPAPRTVRDRMRFEYSWDDDGMLDVRLRLDAETGAAFLTGVDSLAERAARRERAGGAGNRAVSEGVPDGLAEDDEVALARERTTARRCAALGRLAAAAADADRRAGDPPRREVVVHVDAAVLADDAAAGAAHIEGGPALHPSQVRRMLCEATVVAMLERGREPLAVGRARRFATRAQRRALYRRDGGCSRPGCPETRIERLHAHHLRHWLFGGATDVSNMALLCDADHGLVHDLDLVLHRRDGELIALTPDGRRVWGRADAAFRAGLDAPDVLDRPGADDVYAGVHPIDQLRARRPGVPAGAPGSPQSVPRPVPEDEEPTGPASIGRLLFADAEPELPDALHVNGERMDLHHVVWALLGHRDLVRRLAAESGGGPLTAVA
ncbi:HNH endonuclease signature motif containing protein [Blastococcus sp. TF02A-26]|uniref:HNH endonuclease signature motif containing protein n=1 Tax=Blastococcus sp. TF02A-26 TaxID=2250577 RepID=UPI000DEBF7E6|nr:HNH endonuclease signature motif containing protein [Blastococcus sp. TF02A-26]RBY84264.1 HNH endonuclease [Blastococcus sp. TF02A-26]